MRIRLYVSVLFFCLSAFVPVASAGPVTVNYIEAVVSGPTVVSLPYALGPGAVNVRLKFFVPEFASLTSLNSLNVSVNLFDDNDASADNGEVVFALNGAGLPNIVLNSFTTLGGFTSGSPYTANSSLTGTDLTNALTEIQGDGYFFVRVNRNPPSSSDFFVQSASVTIDGKVSSVPEPATIGLLGAGLGAGIVLLRRRVRA
jgi:hypothetical protein